jgi:hypothetical protein
MALIPGTLPNDTCYGTPQDLLELFAQYLDVPAFALSSKVVFSTTNTGFTSDIVWFDTTSATRPIMKITVSSSGFIDYVKNYITAAPVVTIVGADSILILDASDSGNTKRGLVSDISVPAAGSITFPMLSTSATEADNVASRTAKAWVNFDGTTNTGGNCTIRADLNVSTVADNGTGNYTVNFTTSMANVNYVVSGLAIGKPTDAVNYANTMSMRTISTSGFSLFTGSPHIAGFANPTEVDATVVSVAVFS